MSRGSLEEKLCWTFQLYDINSDGHITREEMSDIVTAVYGLMGHPLEDKVNEEIVKEKVESMFNVSIQLCPKLICTIISIKLSKNIPEKCSKCTKKCSHQM